MGKIRRFSGKANLPLLDIGQIRGALFDIFGDVRGKQNGDAFVRQREKDLQELVSGNRVKTAGRLIQ